MFSYKYLINASKAGVIEAVFFDMLEIDIGDLVLREIQFFYLVLLHKINITFSKLVCLRPQILKFRIKDKIFSFELITSLFIVREFFNKNFGYLVI